MDDLIGRRVACAGGEWTAADRAVGNRLQLPVKQGSSANARAPVRDTLAADTTATALSSSPRSPRTFGAIGLPAVGSNTGRFLATTCTTQRFTRVHAFARVEEFARVNAGEDAVGGNAGAVPHLGRFV
jgi:hypothetical protein